MGLVGTGLDRFSPRRNAQAPAKRPEVRRQTDTAQVTGTAGFRAGLELNRQRLKRSIVGTAVSRWNKGWEAWLRGASPGLMGSGWFAGFWKKGEREEPRARDENKT